MARTVVDREFFHRVLKGTTETISSQWEQDGSAVSPGTVTIGVVNDAGTTVVAALTATGGATTAPRTYALTKVHTNAMDRLVVTWTSDTFNSQVTYVEVVGAHLFSISEAREFDNAALSNTSTYPTQDIEEARARITDEFERICGMSFVPRYDRVVLSGDGNAWLQVRTSQTPRNTALYLSSIRAVETLNMSDLTWDAYSVGDLADVQPEPGGVIRRATGGVFNSGYNNIRVTYEYGMTPPPAIKRAALTLCRYLLVSSNLTSRAMQQSAEFGTIQLATAGRYGDHYGIPAVDSVLDRYCEKPVVFG